MVPPWTRLPIWMASEVPAGWLWKWHFRHSVWLRSVSIFWFGEPCGLWQEVQPSRVASCSKIHGPRCWVWQP